MSRLSLTLPLVAALLLGGCAQGGGDTLSTIVASPWPLAWLAEQVAPDAAITELSSAGQDPHDLELGPRDRALLRDADVVLLLGVEGYQPQVERAIAGRAGRVVTAAAAAASLLLPAQDADDHHEPVVDPHLWFDPRILAATATALAEQLAQVDPAGAEGYRERATTAAAELESLGRELRARFASCARDTVVVSHGAFGYLLRDTGVRQVGLAGLSGHEEVSPARLAELVGLVRAEDLTVVLAEPGEARRGVEALAREAGLGVVEVDPLESPIAARRSQGLPNLLRAQAAAFAQALECAG